MKYITAQTKADGSPILDKPLWVEPVFCDLAIRYTENVDAGIGHLFVDGGKAGQFTDN